MQLVAGGTLLSNGRYAPAVTSVVPVALVTGAAVRLGAAIAHGLADAGYRVWVHHHTSADAARALAEELATRALGPVAADLRDERARVRLCREVTAPGGPAAGRLDLLVNSAASFERGAFERRTDEDLRRVLELNLVAPLSLSRGLADPLRARAGAIVNLLDLGAFDPWPEYTDHCVAKAGLEAATRALAVELAPVRVNAVAPGPVLPAPQLPAEARAELAAKIPGGALPSVRAVVDAVTFLARTPDITGQTLVVDGGQRAARAGRRPAAESP